MNVTFLWLAQLVVWSIYNCWLSRFKVDNISYYHHRSSFSRTVILEWKATILDERPTMFASIFDNQNLALILYARYIAKTRFGCRNRKITLLYFVIAQNKIWSTQDYQHNITDISLWLSRFSLMYHGEYIG